MPRANRLIDAISRLLEPPARATDSEVVSPPAEPGPVTERRHSALPDSVERYLRYFAPGHFYSPVPDFAEIAGRATRIFSPSKPVRGVDLREDAQLELFGRLSELARAIDFDAPRFRYRSDNPNYGIGDAMILNAMLRHLRPKRYVEVGSGWSTCMALDTNEEWLSSTMSITAIEPYPELLRSLVRPNDELRIVEQDVQDVELSVFEELEEDDLLFIDCSHVVKTGSDAHYLVTQVLPVLARGVHVHIHDMFWPFEYPLVWVEEGRAWSELYLIQAFLMFNNAFRIEFFNNWFAQNHPAELHAQLPRMAENPGGGLWLSRQA
jgi:hypothetical protein